MKPVFLFLAAVLFPHLDGTAAPHEYFAIKAVDEATGRGIPLVELRTVSNIRYVTDSHGVAAFLEPGLMNRTVFFFVSSHGYVFPKDGFGNAGAMLETVPGKEAVLRLQRLNIAERLYRATGEGIYRDSILLGRPAPITEPVLNGEVSGQDSTVTQIYRGKIHWFWGDTNRPRYPLGQFWTSGATSDLPAHGGLDPGVGVNLRYFVDDAGFSRPIWPRQDEGVMWTDGVLVVKEDGRERMLARFSRMKDLGTKLGHGIGEFDDETNAFKIVQLIDLAEPWRFPSGQALPFKEGPSDYFLFGAPFPNTRVNATRAAVLDARQYEAFTPLQPGTRFAGAKTRLERRADKTLVWGWKPETDPITAADERALLTARLMTADEARFQPRDVDGKTAIEIQGGTVHWNAYRKKWIMIGLQIGGKTSFLGEVWYCEADSPLGPWVWAKRIVTHDRYSFYNPIHHPFFDQENGRVIYFEGTYATTFSGNDQPTARYDYNQVMYRLDLSDPRLVLPGE